MINGAGERSEGATKERVERECEASDEGACGTSEEKERAKERAKWYKELII